MIDPTEAPPMTMAVPLLDERDDERDDGCCGCVFRIIISPFGCGQWPKCISHSRRDGCTVIFIPLPERPERYRRVSRQAEWGM